MTKPAPLNDDDRADLSAYLDGELEGKAAREMAARISLDPQVRAEAAALKQTWELLDYLPRPEPSPTFTHRTVERLSASRPTTGPRRTWPLLFGLGWAAAVLLAAAGGFAGVALYPKDRTEEHLARDLRVIENRRLYEPIEDIDYLWELSNAELFGEETPGS
jgi:anti-sigma factor RsiW